MCLRGSLKYILSHKGSAHSSTKCSKEDIKEEEVSEVFLISCREYYCCLSAFVKLLGVKLLGVKLLSIVITGLLINKWL